MFTRRVVVASVLTMCLVAGVAGTMSPASANQISETTGSHRRLDPAVLRELETKGSADAFVSFRSEHSSDTGPAAHRRAKESLRKRKLAAFDDTGVVAKRDFDELPVTLVHFTSVAQLSKVLTDSSVTDVTLPRMQHVDDAVGGQSDPVALGNIDLPSGARGNGAIVAVLDTGADYTQPAFGSCSAPNVPTTCRISFEHDYATEDYVADDNGHGTNTAGIVANVAPDAKIWALDVSPGNGMVDPAAVLAALNDIAAWKQSGFNVVALNMSFGLASYDTGSCAQPQTYASSLDTLSTFGIVPVASAGNSAYFDGSFHNGVGNPACSSSVLSVGALYDQTFAGTMTWGTQFASGDNNYCEDIGADVHVNQPTCFSQTGPNLGLWAPGSFINAAGRQESGTSQAAPHVAGAVAVLAAGEPTATATQIRAALATTGPLVVDARAPQNPEKHRLDVAGALKALGGDHTPPAITSPSETPLLRSSIGSSNALYAFNFHATDASGIFRTIAYVSTNGGAWRSVSLPSTNATSFALALAFGSRNLVAVRARDGAGNWSSWSYSRFITPTLRQQNGSGIAYSTGWHSATWSSASGGTLMYTAGYKSWVKVTATGTGLAWVASRATNRGWAWVYVDGRYQGAVNTYNATTQARSVVFWTRFASAGTHTLTIVNAATSGRPTIDADAFVVTT